MKRTISKSLKTVLFCFAVIFSCDCLSAGLDPVTDRDCWKAVASSQESDFGASCAIDGDLATRWSSQFKDGEWLEIDLGRVRTVGKITIYWEDAYPSDYKILFSADGQDWKDIVLKNGSAGAKDTIRFNPVEARFVKIICLKRATKWGNSLFEVMFNEPDPINVRASASSGDGAYDPQKAVDGDIKTRWSSNFTDDEWWIGEFENEVTLAGVKMVWETAFGEKYSLQVSSDGKDWKKVYETQDGDGKTDIIFFKPVKAKFFRIEGYQRGTGWGYSIFEIEFFREQDALRFITKGSDSEYKPEFSADGDKETCWKSGGNGERYLTVKLPRTFNLGGVEILWGENYAKSYAVEVSMDGKEWKKVFLEEKGNGDRDWVFFNAGNANFIRFHILKPGKTEPCEIAEFELKSGEEQATPIKNYQALAKDLKEGLFPMWLRRKQEFWTVSGVIGSENEALIGETGTFEPKINSFSIMPFLCTGGKAYTWADVKLYQSLEDSYLPMPSVVWDGGNWSLGVSVLSAGEASNSYAAVKYTVKNNSDADLSARLILGIRPVQLNPVWQHGGFSPISSADFIDKDGMVSLNVNGKTALVPLMRPDKFGASSLTEGDISKYIDDLSVPEAKNAFDPEGKVSAGLLFDMKLKAGESKDIILLFPLDAGSRFQEWVEASNKSTYFNSEWQARKKYWHTILDKYDVEIPEQRLIDIMKSNVAYILINKDGSFIKPGPRNYDHSWVRDGAMTCVALLRAALADEVRKYIDAVTPMISDSGWVPWIFFNGKNPVGFNTDKTGEGHEYDSQGEYVFLVRQYYDYSKDRMYLERIYPAVIRALKFAALLRKENKSETLENTPFYGILPRSNSHEGYFPATHSYWDDFWYLRGLKDGIHLAQVLGKGSDLKWLADEEADFRRCLYSSIDRVMQRDGIKYIPGCAEKGDFDATSTAIAVMACGEEDLLPEEPLQYTFSRYYEDFSKRLIPGGEATFTPYEVRSADAFLRMNDREKAISMLRYFTADSVRPFAWNHFAEVVHADPRAPSYIGDMPHTWVGSGYISAVRTMLVYEKGEKLIVGSGLVPEWFDKGIKVSNLPTMYGKISYSAARKKGNIVFEFSGDAVPPGGFSILLPAGFGAAKAVVNGEAAEISDNSVHFSSLPAKIEVTI
ncbi:MAG: discoidin domain-containing protein [Candidatus Aureabacteria bacterium]|nr:discoidin domain-containing protein [Candidatus Auribacterota bacterium]